MLCNVTQDVGHFISNLQQRLGGRDVPAFGWVGHLALERLQQYPRGVTTDILAAELSNERASSVTTMITTKAALGALVWDHRTGLSPNIVLQLSVRRVTHFDGHVHVVVLDDAGEAPHTVSDRLDRIDAFVHKRFLPFLTEGTPSMWRELFSEGRVIRMTDCRMGRAVQGGVLTLLPTRSCVPIVKPNIKVDAQYIAQCSLDVELSDAPVTGPLLLTVTGMLPVRSVGVRPKTRHQQEDITYDRYRGRFRSDMDRLQGTATCGALQLMDVHGACHSLLLWGPQCAMMRLVRNGEIVILDHALVCTEQSANSASESGPGTAAGVIADLIQQDSDGTFRWMEVDDGTLMAIVDASMIDGDEPEEGDPRVRGAVRAWLQCQTSLASAVSQPPLTAPTLSMSPLSNRVRDLARAPQALPLTEAVQSAVRIVNYSFLARIVSIRTFMSLSTETMQRQFRVVSPTRGGIGAPMSHSSEPDVVCLVVADANNSDQQAEIIVHGASLTAAASLCRRGHVVFLHGLYRLPMREGERDKMATFACSAFSPFGVGGAVINVTVLPGLMTSRLLEVSLLRREHLVPAPSDTLTPSKNGVHEIPMGSFRSLARVMRVILLADMHPADAGCPIHRLHPLLSVVHRVCGRVMMFDVSSDSRAPVWHCTHCEGGGEATLGPMSFAMSRVAFANGVCVEIDDGVGSLLVHVPSQVLPSLVGMLPTDLLTTCASMHHPPPTEMDILESMVGKQFVFLCFDNGTAAKDAMPRVSVAHVERKVTIDVVRMIA